MKSREEFKRARDDSSRRARRHLWHLPFKSIKPKPQAQPEQAAPQKTVVVQAASRHHFWGIIITAIVMFAVILNGTILNQKFIAQEISQSTIGDEIVSKANASLHQYGIEGSVVTHHDVQKLLKQAIGQLYNGQTINLDLSSVDSRLNNAVNNRLASSCVSDSVATSTVTNSLESEVNSTINQSLNTAAVQQAARVIKTARVINMAVIVIGGALIILNLLGALIKHYFLDQVMWLGAGGAVLASALTLVVRQGLPTLAHALPDASELAVSFASDFAAYAMRVIGVGLLCFLLALLLKLGQRVRRRRIA